MARDTGAGAVMAAVCDRESFVSFSRAEGREGACLKISWLPEGPDISVLMLF